ncbi:FAD-dependent oxidoreductase [Kribbella yunnanensis]|uniref:FAD-dependent oxidoreductase n=1 Tax=Kribbella yunnanensis TaxID=190194 RepID=A0ABP4UV01_9ACTN
MTTAAYDVAVVGGGIVGAAVAAELAGERSVVLLEAEPDFGVHATGRSAAMLTQTYGSEEIQELTAASRPAFEGALAERAGAAILRSRPVLWTGKVSDVLLPELRRLAASGSAPGVEWLTPPEAERLAAAIDPETIDLACLEPDAASIEVDLLHRTFLKIAAERGATILRNARFLGARRHERGWKVDLQGDIVSAGLLVNAAGAWADEVAAHAGLSVRGLVPMRRTVLIATCDPPAAPAWPFVVDLDDRFYFEAEGTQVLASPADETPVPAGHPRVDELDVALCIERLHERTRLRIRRVTNSWAGLRTFTSDRLPLVGPDPSEPTFLWAAGLGGFGIMTSPAIAKLIAMHADGAPPSRLAKALLPDRKALRPGRRQAAG